MPWSLCQGFVRRMGTKAEVESGSAPAVRLDRRTAAKFNLIVADRMYAILAARIAQKKQMRESWLAINFTLLALSVVLAGCGGRAYVHEVIDLDDFRARAETRSEGPIRVSAAVPGRQQTEVIFGLDLYEQGIQPVWLEIENTGETMARYAPVSTDPYYFSPLEVAYKNRGGYSDEARADMERHLHAQALPRYIDAGETLSGFVFTHVDDGAKGFNVDVFSSGESYQFMFLLRVPGFVPDYANIDFASIYSADELHTYDTDALYSAVKNLPCCSSDAEGNMTEGTLNVVLIGDGRALLKALLRSRWLETSASEASDREPDFVFGRQQDAIFRYESSADDSLYELRLWLAPMLVDNERVWVGRTNHYFNTGSFRRFDPDIDNARNFTLQNIIYGQALEKLAWVSGEEVAPVESFWTNLIRPPFFTDGHRVVLWISADPVSVLEVTSLDWDNPPGRN